jgi:hypothetical protein
LPALADPPALLHGRPTITLLCLRFTQAIELL